MSRKLGNLGEQVFSFKMKEIGFKVDNVSNNPDYWSKDIDFIITSPSGNTRTFEVKYDNRLHQTGNIYLELTNIHSQGGRGWFDFCQADFLAYGDADSRRFYIIPLTKLREYINNLPQRAASCGKDSTGLLVRIDDIYDIITATI